MRTTCDCCGQLLIICGPVSSLGYECDRCAEENARVTEENAAFDAAEEVKKDAAWKVITDAMACYPSTIPAEWTR